MDTETLHDLTAAYALDALDADEARAYEEHLGSCPRCRDELAALTQTSAALAYAVPPAEPPAGLRERIVSAARAERPSNVVPLRPRWVYPLAAATAVAAASMICVLGPKGGTGKTLTACNLAVGLARGGQKVALVDLDLQFGDVGLALGLAPDRTIYDLAKSGGSLDAEKIGAYLAEHVSGLNVLLAPTRPDHAGLVTVEFLREVYAALRASHDFVVVDTPPGFTPEVIASIDSSSHICIVGMLDSLSLKNTKLGLETLSLMGYDTERISLVLNRADSRVGITREDVVAIVGRAPDVLVPSDREISRSVNEGLPIVLANERSEAARAFRSLATLYEGGGAPVPLVVANGDGAGPMARLRLLRKKA
jgi:pilus assembly protein CpaE